MWILKPDLTLDVAAEVLGVTEDPITAAARYDAALSGETIVLTFKVGGAHKVAVPAVASTGVPGTKVVPNTRTFGLDIATEARELGWKAGHSVIVKPGPTKFTLMLS